MDGDLYYPMSRKKLGHAVIINNLDREQIPTQRSEKFCQKINNANESIELLLLAQAVKM